MRAPHKPQPAVKKKKTEKTKEACLLIGNILSETTTLGGLSDLQEENVNSISIMLILALHYIIKINSQKG